MANENVSKLIDIKTKPPKVCPLAAIIENPCVYSVCPDCLAQQFEEYDAKETQQKDDSLLRQEMMTKKKPTCNHDNPYTLVSIDKEYVVGHYADKIRMKEEDNYLPSHCSVCKGKYIYVKTKQKRRQNNKKKEVASNKKSKKKKGR